MRALILLSALFAAANAFAAIEPHYQDIKLPTQQMIEKQSWAAPVTASSTYVVNLAAGPTSAAAASILAFAHQPDFARNLTLQSSAPDYNKQGACAVVINGTDYLNHAIAETFSLAAGQSTAVTGNKAFASVTSVAFPASCVLSPFNINYAVGVGTKLGLKRCMADAGAHLHSVTDGVKDATAATIAADASTVSLNTIITNTAPNSTRNFADYFMQNYACVR